MNCKLQNSSATPYFGNNQNPNLKNAPLNFGVIAPPNNLPNTSLYNQVNSYQSQAPLPAQSARTEVQKKQGGEGISAGKLSAGCAFLGIVLSALSLLSFIKKK